MDRHLKRCLLAEEGGKELPRTRQKVIINDGITGEPSMNMPFVGERI